MHPPVWTENHGIDGTLTGCDLKYSGGTLRPERTCMVKCRHFPLEEATRTRDAVRRVCRPS